MNTLQLFNYGSQEVRTELIDGEPWFVAADVARILEYSATSAMTRRLDDEDKGVRVLHTHGGDQEMTVVSEPGLFESILGSHLDGAKAFKRWITHEVLPSIRKTGTYSTAPALPQSYSEALRELAANVEAKELAEARARELEIPAAAWGVMVAAHGDYAVDEAAKILSRDSDLGIGRNRLFDFMADLGWTYRQGARNSWHAYQSQVDTGRIVLRMSAAFLNAKTGEMENPAPTLRITAKGIDALRIALLKRELAA
jgi:anti-repressor protein